jgi:hypothetical protein
MTRGRSGPLRWNPDPRSKGRSLPEMRRPAGKQALWAGAIVLAYCGLVALAYAIGPVSAGCSVFGHGRITTASGDQASFRGLAASQPARGSELYVDNGPQHAFRLTSLSVTRVTCDGAASSASISGRATASGSGPVQYVIAIRLPAAARGGGSYRIRLSNGYDSGAGPLRHADLDIHSGRAERHHQDPDAAQTSGSAQDGG